MSGYVLLQRAALQTNSRFQNGQPVSINVHFLKARICRQTFAKLNLWQQITITIENIALYLIHHWVCTWSSMYISGTYQVITWHLLGIYIYLSGTYWACIQYLFTHVCTLDLLGTYPVQTMQVPGMYLARTLWYGSGKCQPHYKYQVHIKYILCN